MLRRIPVYIFICRSDKQPTCVHTPRGRPGTQEAQKLPSQLTKIAAITIDRNLERCSYLPMLSYHTCSTHVYIIGIDLPPGLRGKESVEDAEGRKSKKHDREEEPPGAQLADPKNPDGLQQIQGLVENLSELRRRKKVKRTTTQSLPAPAPASSEAPLARNPTTGVGGEVAGKFVR